MQVIWEAVEIHSFFYPDLLAAFNSCELRFYSHDLLFTFLHSHPTWVELLTPSWLQLGTEISLSPLSLMSSQVPQDGVRNCTAALAGSWSGCSVLHGALALFETCFLCCVA